MKKEDKEKTTNTLVLQHSYSEDRQKDATRVAVTFFMYDSYLTYSLTAFSLNNLSCYLSGRIDLVFHAVTGTFDHDDFRMMKESVKDGGSKGVVVIEDRSPLLEGLVSGQEDRAAFIASADDLEEQIGALLINR